MSDVCGGPGTGKRASSRGGAARRLSLFLQSLRARAALPHLAGRVLDVGCDSASLVRLLPGCHGYVGVDVDPERVRAAEKAHPDVELHCLDVCREAVPAGDGFDSLVALAVIEHLSQPRAFLDRFVPLLNRGARIVLTTPTPFGERVHGLLRRLGLTSAACADLHEKIYRRGELEELLRTYGFEITESRRFELGMNRLVVGSLEKIEPGSLATRQSAECSLGSPGRDRGADPC